MSMLAQGCYHYWLDGERQTITEPWQLQRDAYGLRLRGERLRDGKPLLRIDARYRSAQCRQMTVAWCDGRRLDYRLEADQLRWHSASTERQLRCPPDALLFPLLRVAAGPLLRALDDGERCVVLPDLRRPGVEGFLHPLLSMRHAQRQADVSPTHYRYYGGEYGAAGADYLLDARGLLQAYRWASAHGLWQVELAELQLAPEFGQFG